jgi:hypothetical protein
MVAAVIEIDCLRGKNNEFVVKELTICGPGFHQTFQFLPPYSEYLLSKGTKRLNKLLYYN